MTQEEGILIAERIKNGQASHEEIFNYIKFLNQTTQELITFLQNSKSE